MRKRSKIVLVSLGLFLLALVLYVLGVGLAFRLVSFGRLDSETFDSLYGILIHVVMDGPDWLKDLYNWYTDFWLDL